MNQSELNPGDNFHPDGNWGNNLVSAEQLQFIRDALERDLITDDELKENAGSIQKLWQFAAWSHLLIVNDAWRGSYGPLFKVHYDAVSSLMYDHSLGEYYKVRLVPYEKAHELGLIGSVNHDELSNLREQIAARDERITQMLQSFSDSVPKATYQALERRTKKLQDDNSQLRDQLEILKRQMEGINSGHLSNDGKDPATGIAILAAAAIWYIKTKNK